MTGARTDRGERDGFVLIAVLTVLTLLSAIVVVVSRMSRDSVDAAILSSQETRHEAMVQSGLSLAAYELFQLALPPERVSGQQFRFDEGVILLTVSTDAGKVDLNASGRELLAAAYTAAGLTSLSPQVFAARVIDWRDPDDDLSDDGAEASNYADAKLGHRPRNGPFRHVDDLRWVLGVSAPDIQSLRSFVTMHNPRGRLDVFAAPASIIRALPKVAPETVDEVLEARANRSAAATEKLEDLLLVQASLIDAAPPATYRIGIQVMLDDTARPGRVDAVITAGVTTDIPFHVLYWSGDQ